MLMDKISIFKFNFSFIASISWSICLMDFYSPQTFLGWQFFFLKNKHIIFSCCFHFKLFFLVMTEVALKDPFLISMEKVIF